MKSGLERDPAVEPDSDSEHFEAQVKSTGTRWAKLGLSTRFIRANGVDLHVAEGGSGKPLVLLHGYPQSGESWRLIAPELIRSHRVIIPDLRGMGLSGIAPGGYDLPNLAEDIHQLVAHLICLMSLSSATIGVVRSVPCMRSGIAMKPGDLCS